MRQAGSGVGPHLVLGCVHREFALRVQLVQAVAGAGQQIPGGVEVATARDHARAARRLQPGRGQVEVLGRHRIAAGQAVNRVPCDGHARAEGVDIAPPGIGAGRSQVACHIARPQIKPIEALQPGRNRRAPGSSSDAAAGLRRHGYLPAGKIQLLHLKRIQRARVEAHIVEPPAEEAQRAAGDHVPGKGRALAARREAGGSRTRRCCDRSRAQRDGRQAAAILHVVGHLQRGRAAPIEWAIDSQRGVGRRLARPNAAAIEIHHVAVRIPGQGQQAQALDAAAGRASRGVAADVELPRRRRRLARHHIGAEAFDPVDVDVVEGAVKDGGHMVPGIGGEQLPGRRAQGIRAVAEAEAQVRLVGDRQVRIGQRCRRIGAAGNDGQGMVVLRLRVDPGRLGKAPPLQSEVLRGGDGHVVINAV